MRRTQIGVIGSCSDLAYSDTASLFAQKLGKLIAESNMTLMFGAEKDTDSLPTIAASAAVTAGGESIGLTYQAGLDIFKPESVTTVIATGLVRGGGRETSLVLSCDALVALSGGSGTLAEISMAYQADIPVILVTGFGGWSDKLQNTYLDDRKRYKFQSASTPDDVIKLLKDVLKN